MSFFWWKSLRKSFTVWFTEGVDRQNSADLRYVVEPVLPDDSVCAKNKNASWVFSVGDFVFESLFCAQRLWILILKFSAET